MSEPTDSEIEAGTAALRIYIGSDNPNLTTAVVAVLRAVFPDHDSRLRGEIADDLTSFLPESCRDVGHAADIVRRGEQWARRTYYEGRCD